MYRAHCEYAGNVENVLSFTPGKVFNLIEQIDEHWWSMQDEYGNHGLVPASYLEVNDVSEDDVLVSIKRSMEAVHQLAARQQRTINDTERRNLQKLSKNYDVIRDENSLWSKKTTNEIIPQQPKRQAPKAPAATSSSSGKKKSSKRYSAPPPPSDVSEADRHRNGSTSSNDSSPSELPTSSTKTTTTTTQISASSKVYNIQVSHGDISPIHSNNITSPTLPTTAVTTNNDNKIQAPTTTHHNNSKTDQQKASKKLQRQKQQPTSSTSPYVLSVVSTSLKGKQQQIDDFDFKDSVNQSIGNTNYQHTNNFPSSTEQRHLQSTITNKDPNVTVKSGKEHVDLASYQRESVILGPESKTFPAAGATMITVTKSDASSSKHALNSPTTESEKSRIEPNSVTQLAQTEGLATADGNTNLKTLQGANFTITKSETSSKHTITQTQQTLVENKNSTTSTSTVNHTSAPSSHLKALQVDLRATMSTAEIAALSADNKQLGTSTQPVASLMSETDSIISKDSFLSSTNSAGVSVTTVDSDDRTLVPSSFSSVGGFSSGAIHVSDEFGKQLVDDVRERCKISFNKALAAVRCVLRNLGNEVPEINQVTRTIEKQIQNDRLHVYKGSLAAEDSQRFYSLLDQLTLHKEDSQQRNWAVHEDFETIKDLLDEVVTVMDEIDPSICRAILQEDENRYINDLILYYQMEHRPKLRIALLHVFGCCCQLGEEFVSTLLCSVLPTELAQDIMQDQSDSMKFLSSALMLTMIFSTGEPVPYQHYVQFNDDFVHFVLNTIEDPPDNDTSDQVPDCLIGMLLAFNQHFKAPRSSTLIQVLKTRTVFRTLTEKILLLLNRETDPCALFEYVNPCPDSVLKFFIDVFSAKETSEMFFTNDLYVLFDIILRQLVNREEKDKVRTEYLSLFHSILNTTNYREHQRHANDFKRRFSEILRNQENESEVDIYIVREIMTRFGDLFDV